jgi:putative ABC transport system permease protein
MPDWREPIRARLRQTLLDPAREAEIVEELTAHLDDRYAELLSTGVGETRARRIAITELARLHIPVRAGLREPLPLGSNHGGNPMTHFRHDLKVSARTLRGKPGFSAAVVFLLAIGVAGNAAIFSIFNGLFLRPLPFAEPGRLVDLDETAPKWNLTRVSISSSDYALWTKDNSTFDGMAFYDGGGMNVAEPGGAARRIDTAKVTWNLLDVEGLKPALGRNFLAEEDRPHGAAVVMLSYDLWQRMFHGDVGIVGRTLKFDEKPHTVIGVLPREAVVPPKADAWFPLQADTTRGDSYYLSGIGRLKHGVTAAQAQADLTRVHRSEKNNAGLPTSPILTPVRDRFLGDFKAVTRILLGAVGVVLLIACVNIAGLMLVRGQARSREIAIRTAIGASRSRVIAQLLTESALLALIGGALGVLLGKAALTGLVVLMPDDLPRWVSFGLDARFALFCAGVTGAAAILFGLAPALQAAAVDANGCLQETARSTLGRGKRDVLGALVVCEIALALILLVSSGLLVQAFRKVLNGDPGFRAQNTLTWTLRLPDATYPKPAQQYAFYHGLIEKLQALPGAASVSAANIIPLDGHMGYFYKVESGRQIGSDEKNPVILQVTAMAGYFDAMGIPLKAGRGFDVRDEQPDAPKVAIVNETFARYFWGHTDVIGKRIAHPAPRPDWFQVVGVVRDMRHYGLDAEVRPEVLVPFSVSPRSGMTLAIHSTVDPRALTASAREIVRQMDADVPMFNIRTMAERMDRSLWTRRAYSWLFASFAAVAMLLAAAGIYGVISFAVTQRTREIGIRMALGARPGQVMRSVLGRGMALVGIGSGLGLLGAQLTARLLGDMLFGVSPRDVVTYAVVLLTVGAAGFAANYLPARRAARVEPMRALQWGG